MSEALYHSPRGLFPFQSGFAVRCATQRSSIVAADPGLGKTHIALASIAALFEHGLVDTAIVVSEKNKVSEWVDDIKEYTRLSCLKYAGPPAQRGRALQRIHDVQVVLTTYGAVRSDGASFDEADTRKPPSPGPLLDALVGRRVIVILDEFAILGGHTSMIHRAVALMISTLRGAGQCWGVGLTGTPVTVGPESYFNLGSVLEPDLLGSRDQFFADHVVEVDTFGRPKRFRDLEALADKMGPLLLRKRKTDPDVFDLFPTEYERFVPLELSLEHRDAYDTLTEMVDEMSESRQRFTFGIMSQFACHPRSVLRSVGEFAESFVADIGADALGAMESVKSTSLIEHLSAIPPNEGVIVFCRFTSVLEALLDDLVAVGVNAGLYVGSMSPKRRDEAKAMFRSGEMRVLLASSAAERGINLPEAKHIVNFDVPLTHSSYLQRLSRGSRIGARGSDTSLHITTLISEGTADAGSLSMWETRNYQTDVLTNFDAEDENFVPSNERFRGVYVRRNRRGGSDGHSGVGRKRGFTRKAVSSQ